jgi:hypothetical protein
MNQSSDTIQDTGRFLLAILDFYCPWMFFAAVQYDVFMRIVILACNSRKTATFSQVEAQDQSDVIPAEGSNW